MHTLRIQLRCVLFLTGLSAAVLLNGCGGDRGPQRVLVSGTVSYNGTPVAEGRIRFTPVASSPTPVSGAYIVNGRYKIDCHGGVPIGTHKIQIEGYGRAASAAAPDLTNPASANLRKDNKGGQYLPGKYNRDTQLEVTIEPGSGNIVKDFDLKD
jgi:hypothetical protein